MDQGHGDGNFGRDQIPLGQGHGHGGNGKRGRGDENLGRGNGNDRGRSRVRRNRAVKVVNGKRPSFPNANQKFRMGVKRKGVKVVCFSGWNTRRIPQPVLPFDSTNFRKIQTCLLGYNRLNLIITITIVV